MGITRFGVSIHQTTPASELVARWRHAEDLGFDDIWVADHLQYPERVQLEAWTTLGALARETSRVRIGVLVTQITFRPPALVAQMAIAVDHLSGGRVEFGIGAGGGPKDDSAAGVDAWTPGERVERLEEQCLILVRLLRGEELEHEGRHYRVRGRVAAPVQHPRPPLVVAANGPRSLGVVARHADAWNTLGGRPQGALPNVTLDEALAETRRQCGILDERCREIGRDPRSVRRSLLAFRAEPDPLASPDAFAEYVERYGALGIDELVAVWPVTVGLGAGEHAARLAVLERVAADVLPRYR